jgi:hypothetical protein
MSAVLVGAIHYFDLWEFVGDVNEAFLSIDPILMKIGKLAFQIQLCFCTN